MVIKEGVNMSFKAVINQQFTIIGLLVKPITPIETPRVHVV